MSEVRNRFEDMPRGELIELARMQAATIDSLEKQNQEMEAQLNAKNPTERLDQPYSENGEEGRKKKGKTGKSGKVRKRPKPIRQGRIRTAEKIERAQQTEAIYPENIESSLCALSHTRVARRLEDGKAILVAYQVYCVGLSIDNRQGIPPSLYCRVQTPRRDRGRRLYAAR